MNVDLARWQFAITTLYHFIFVPITMGLSVLVAAMETAYYRTKDPAYRRMTLFWGKLFLINVAMGVVTGIVQEFQFGMNWSAYSRFVGDIFGAPLAIEGLVAFFLESTFLGVWLFGWDRLSPRAHLATIWLVAVGTQLSAFFILMANSWMQHPVGYVVDRATGRAELRDFGAVLSNPTLLVAYPHTAVASFLTAGALVFGVSVWHLARHSDDDVFRRSAALGAAVTVAAAVFTGFTGHAQAQIMTQQQPMKMAAAEALYHGESGAPFSLFAIGDVTQSKLIFNVPLPHLLSVLATNTWDGRVEGIDDIQAAYQRRYGPGDYRPNVAVTYWTFRIMVGMAFLTGAICVLGLWLWRRGRLASTAWYRRLALAAIALPFVGNFTGWIFTEMGRQPWTVFGVLKTAASASPSVGVGTVATSLVVFLLLYGALAAVDLGLMVHFARKGTAEGDEHEVGELGGGLAY